VQTHVAATRSERLAERASVHCASSKGRVRWAIDTSSHARMPGAAPCLPPMMGRSMEPASCGAKDTEEIYPSAPESLFRALLCSLPTPPGP
jgi:hypothetical protein